jgi:hypothetical protein
MRIAEFRCGKNEGDWLMQFRTFLTAVALGVAAALLTSGTAAQATTITLSTASSDETDPNLLSATFEFQITGATELTLTVTNDTTSPNAYNINQIFFNAAGNIAGLGLDSATHSAEGDVTGAWAPVDVNTMVNGFGVFDFGLTDGVGETDPSVIGENEFVTFKFSISGTGPFDMTDFKVENAKGFLAAAKFVSGPGDDSAFGAVPEPSTALLLGLGLGGLTWASRKGRRH